MKKTLKMLLVMGLLAIMTPLISKAATRTYAFPDGAIGISEATYKQLKNAEYTDTEHYDQILYQYQNKIVFRADHAGEMYRVPFVGEKPYNPTRYLPDGFYKAGKKYYWLSDGQKMRLPKNAEYSTIYNAITAKTMDYVGVTENDFSAMGQTCEYYGNGDANTDPTYSACLAEYNRGNELRETLQGKIIIRSEYDGSIFFVENGANHDRQALFDIEKYSTFRKEILKNYSFTVKKSLMKQIPKYDQYKDIVYENSTYGFTLIFPETWKDYTVKNATFDGPTLGSYSAVGFGFKAQDALFYVSMYSKSQWVELQSEEGPTPTYLAENNRYVFTYSTAQDAANNKMVDRMAEVKDIVKTFYLN